MSNVAQRATAGAGNAEGVFDALFPRQCLLCLAPSAGCALCAGCSADLPRMGSDNCPVCALPTPGGAVCGACLKRPPHFDATSAVYLYRFPVDRLVHSLKYGHRLAGADFLGDALRDAHDNWRPDVLLPVPLSAARLAERGFNQALELARPLARRLGLAIETEGVLRGIDTAPQAGLPWKERARNMRHAFECRIDFGGLSVLVIDDVMTTGATLDELAATLKAAGASRVANLVLARALKE